MDNPTDVAVLLTSEMQIKVPGHIQLLQLLWLVRASPAAEVRGSSWAAVQSQGVSVGLPPVDPWWDGLLTRLWGQREGLRGEFHRMVSWQTVAR